MSQVEAVREALSKVQDPELHRSLTELGMVESIDIDGGTARITVLLTISGCPMQDRLREDITKAVLEVDGLSAIDLTFGAMSQEQRDKVKSIVRGGRDKVIPFDLLKAELFYPTKNPNCQPATFCHRLAEEIATAMLIELRDPQKAAATYLSSAMGKYSRAVISEDDRKASMGMMAHNSTPESNHATSTTSLITGGMISLYHAAAERQT